MYFFVPFNRGVVPWFNSKPNILVSFVMLAPVDMGCLLLSSIGKVSEQFFLCLLTVV